jgi:rare lipoprotein A
MLTVRTGAMARSLMVLLIGGASLAACATVQPRYSAYAPKAEAQPAEAPRPAPPPTGGRRKVGSPYQVGGVWYVPRDQPGYNQIGTASWYGADFHRRPTANGEIFDMNAITAAHTTLPLPSIVEVTNLGNGRKLQVRVNDRGPFVGGRIIDLSRAAALELGYQRAGTARVRVRYVGPAPLDGMNPPLRFAANTPPPGVPRPASAHRTGKEPLGSGPWQPVTGRAIAAGPLRDPYAASRVYRVQAAAYADQGSARRAKASLKSTGAAEIERMERQSGNYYRVVLVSGSDEDQAWALRDLVVSMGYSDARVLRPN